MNLCRVVAESQQEQPRDTNDQLSHCGLHHFHSALLPHLNYDLHNRRYSFQVFASNKQPIMFPPGTSASEETTTALETEVKS